MKYIIGYYRKFLKFLVLNLLYGLIEKILTFDIGKPDGISKSLSRKIVTNLKTPSRIYPDPSLDPYLPIAIIKEPPNYLDLPALHKIQNSLFISNLQKG